jgi:uncharacterized protein YecT (DUF1311 family)
VGPNAARTQCFLNQAQCADTELNTTFAAIRKVLSIADQEALRTAQWLWLRFSEANCDAERDLYGGGSAGPMVCAACIAGDTRQRTAEMKTMCGWRLK